MSTDSKQEFAPLEIEGHEDMVRHMREISRRLNAHPEIGRMMFINAVLALEEVGAVLSPAMKQHVMDSLRFPAKLERKLERLEAELRVEVPELLGRSCELPLKDDERAELLFRRLELRPRDGDECHTGEITSRRARAYRRRHPVLDKLAEYDRGRQGAFVFYPRSVYEQFRRGERHLGWLQSIRFKE